MCGIIYSDYHIYVVTIDGSLCCMYIISMDFDVVCVTLEVMLKPFRMKEQQNNATFLESNPMFCNLE